MNKDERKDMMSKLLPNTSPFPNVIMDEQEQLGCCIWSLLEAPEHALLPIVYRKTFGWWKPSDKISQSQLVKASGLALATVRKYMRNLERIGLVVYIPSRNQNDGMEWAPQTDDEKIDFAYLRQRADAKQAADTQRTQKAQQAAQDLREGTRNKKGLLSHSSPTVAQQGRATVAHNPAPTVAQQPQKQEKTRKTNRLSIPLSIENQIAVGMEQVVPLELDLLKQAVVDSFGINVKWGSAACPKNGMSPLDFEAWLLTQKITVAQVQHSGKVWQQFKKFGWRTPTLYLIWENWNLLLKEVLPDEEAPQEPWWGKPI